MKKLLFSFVALLCAFAATAQCNPQFTWAASTNPATPLQMLFTNTTVFTPPVSTAYPQYSISFGDNTAPGTGFYNTRTHNYATAGTYNVTTYMKVYDSLTSQLLCSDSIMHQITVGNPPSPCYTTFNIQNLGGGNYNFTANTPSGSAGATYNWNFGDGTTGTGSPVSHAYTGIGYHNVTLVTTKAGCTYTKTDSVYTYNPGPPNCDSLHANFGAYPGSGLSVSFVNQSTYYPSFDIYQEPHWYFGDGSTNNYNNAPTHTYSTPGTYYVTLVNLWKDSLTMGVVCSDSITLPVTVGYNTCYSTFTPSSIGGSGYSFTATTPSGSTSTNYSWNFGDGATATGNPVSHTYSSNGYYIVSLTATDSGCYSYSVDTIHVNNGALTLCDSLNANIQLGTISGLSISLYNNATYVNTLENNGIWSFGDGSTTTTTSYMVNHTYAAPGTYTVNLINQWKDSVTQAVICSDTTSQSFTVTNPTTPVNEISGYIVWDSMGVSAFDSFKVWLIKYDSTTNMLSAIDSTLTAGFSYSAPYSFGAQAAGQYRIKAASLISAPGTIGLVPTYHTSSLYWSSASIVNHTGGTSANKNIWMQTGTVTSGPGFVAGNVSLGAGRGTNTGVPDMLIFLRNSSNGLVSSTYTDADGDFEFEHIPMGSYTVYPESINYATTAAAVVIGDGQNNKTGIDFEQTESEILPKNVTSLKDIATENDIKVYPNPFRNQIMIDNKTGNYSQVSFITVTGQVVYKQNIKQGNNSISTGGLVPGVYFLLINGKEKTGRMTVTKQ